MPLPGKGICSFRRKEPHVDVDDPPPPTTVQITNSQYPWPEVWKQADDGFDPERPTNRRVSAWELTF